MSVQRQIDRLIALQAAQWYERLRDDQSGACSTDKTQFVSWITESPRNLEGFLAIAGQAPLVRKVFDSGVFDLGALLQNAQPDVLHLPGLDRAGGKPLPSGRWQGGKRSLKYWPRAAAVTALALGAVFYYRMLAWDRFETPIGEQRAVQLLEGSVVNLNVHSRVDVRFDDSERDIRLAHGEATFKVARDPSRPFRVHAPGAMVEAVGTQFNVYARPDGATTVTVLEGKVKVTSDKGGAATPVLLAAGEEAQILGNGRIEREARSDVAEAVVWQQRKLIFKRTSLDDMAAEFNRYNKATHIRVEGLDREAFRFSGAFDADDPQSLTTILMREPDLVVESRGNSIVIRGRQVPESR